jgi:hypothetical protein
LTFAHVIENVFKLPDDHSMPIVLVQAGIVEIGNVISMPYACILDLTYLDNQGNEHLVGKGDKYRLRIRKNYHYH